MTTGQKIKDLRQKKGLSQEELGALLGVKKAAIHKYETGIVVNLKRSTIDKLAAILDVSPTYLLGYGDSNTPDLNDKDRRDIARDLERIMSDLEYSGDLMFDGDPMSDAAKESIASAMKLGLEAAKAKNKERFTPKKYRRVDSEEH